MGMTITESPIWLAMQQILMLWKPRAGKSSNIRFGCGIDERHHIPTNVKVRLESKADPVFDRPYKNLLGT